MAEIHGNFNSDEKMKHLAFLNIYKFNLYQILNIMLLIKTNSIPEALQNKFKVTEHNNSRRYIEYIFKELNVFFMVAKFAISLRGPRLQDKHTKKFLKRTNLLPLFKAKIKNCIIKLKKNPFIFNNDLKVRCT